MNSLATIFAICRTRSWCGSTEWLFAPCHESQQMKKDRYWLVSVAIKVNRLDELLITFGSVKHHWNDQWLVQWYCHVPHFPKHYTNFSHFAFLRLLSISKAFFPHNHQNHFIYLFIYYFLFFICSEFCHTLKWNSHGFTCVPHPDPPSHLPLHPLPLGLPSAPGPSSCLMHPTWDGGLFHPW